ncbi:MAG: glucose dehydrogenase-B [Neobacillus sp.]|nr:glucose dehydrogenase-B [Neobacillus sp.]
MSGCSFFEKEELQQDDEDIVLQPQVEQDDEAIVLQPEIEVIAENLRVPWSIDMNKGVFYLSERTGSIVKVENGKTERQQVSLKKPLAKAAEAGLLGFVLDPKFPNSQKAFAYYTYSDNGRDQFNRVVVLGYEGERWTEGEILLDRIPSAAYHHGGRLKIGPDGMLYITTGDATIPDTAQDLATLNGKILRMNLDGTIPDDNPFPNSYVYSYGHRNPQGLVWIGKTLYASEHGQSAHDEVNQIKPAANYGWPVIEGWEEKAGMETPLFQSEEETWAPSGMAAFDGKLYTATLRGNAVREFDLGKKATSSVIDGLGRIRDLFIDGDYLYFVSNNTDGRGTPDEKDDKLYRVLLSNLK